MPIRLKREYWSSTKIDRANYCDYKFFLIYVLGLGSEALNMPYFVKGNVFHKSIENFWLLMHPHAYENDSYLREEISQYKQRHPIKTDELFKNKNSKSISKEENFDVYLEKHSEKKPTIYKYHDAESFADYVKRQWWRPVIADKSLREKLITDISKKEKKKIQKRLIHWEFEDEPYVIANKISNIVKPLYNYLFKEGPPLYSELKFDFVIDGLELNGKNIGTKGFFGYIDEVRIKNGKAVIRDYKSGSPYEIKEMKKEFDPQLTFYNLGLCALCYDDEKLAVQLGVSNIRHQFMGNPMLICPEFDHEFFMVEAPGIIENSRKIAPKVEDFSTEKKYQEDYAKWKNQKDKIKTLPEVTIPTKRYDYHFSELIKMIYGAEEIKNRKNIYAESGRKCDRCEMRVACARTIRENQDKLEIGKIDENGQRFLSFVEPPTKVSIRNKAKQTQEQYVQRLFDFRKREPWKGRV